MLLTTTSSVEGYQIENYVGLVTGEVIVGANVIKDIFASFRDFFGGRARSYESTLSSARQKAIEDMIVSAMDAGADAVIGIDLDYETIGKAGSMLMVTASGTAVQLGRLRAPNPMR